MDWTAVSPEAQKQKSLICFIRFYVTVFVSYPRYGLEDLIRMGQEIAECEIKEQQ